MRRDRCGTLAALGLTAVGWAPLATLVGCAADPPTGSVARPADALALIGPSGDWLAQDYEDSRGVHAVRREGRGLRLDARLRGGDAHLEKGEAYTDLRYFVGLEPGAVDLAGRTVRVVVDVPESFVGARSAPNGVQAFVKDSEFRSQYSKYLNVGAGGRHEVALSPSASGDGAAFTAAGFDPSRVRVVGVKVSIGGRSSHSSRERSGCSTRTSPPRPQSGRRHSPTFPPRPQSSPAAAG